MGTNKLARTAAERIARERLGIKSPEARGTINLRVDALRQALEAAYEEGWRQAHAAQRLVLQPGDIQVVKPGDE